MMQSGLGYVIPFIPFIHEPQAAGISCIRQYSVSFTAVLIANINLAPMLNALDL